MIRMDRYTISLLLVLVASVFAVTFPAEYRFRADIPCTKKTFVAIIAGFFLVLTGHNEPMGIPPIPLATDPTFHPKTEKTRLTLLCDMVHPVITDQSEVALKCAVVAKEPLPRKVAVLRAKTAMMESLDGDIE